MKKSIYYILPLLIAIGITEQLEAQSISKSVANKKFRQQSYAEAIPLYERVYEKKPDDREVVVKLAECYRHIKDTKKALMFYAMLAHEENPAAENIWNYAQHLAMDQQYEDAAKWYKRYAEMEPQDDKGQIFAQAYQNLDQFFLDSVSYSVQYMHTINSWQADFSPVFYKKGILFCSGRQHEAVIRKVYAYDQTSLLNWYYISDTSAVLNDLNAELHKTKYTVSAERHKNDDFSRYSSLDFDIPAHYGNTFLFDSVRYTSRPVATIKSLDHPHNKKHVGPVCFFEDQETIVYTVNELDHKSKKNHLCLYMATYKNKKFTDIKRLPFNNDNFSCGHPAFSPDYKRLYFTSNNPEGMGGTDIYYVSYDNGTWSDPVNMREINTPGNESFPYVDKKGNLYFSSDGHPGLGGLDIFCASWSDGYLTEMKNLGYPMNSSNDDFGIIFANSMEGYFSSNRKRGFSDDDLYYFQRGCRQVELFVYNEKTGEPLADASVKVEGKVRVTNLDGRVRLCLKGGDNRFALAKDQFEQSEVTSGKDYLEVPLKALRFNVEGLVTSDGKDSPLEGVNLQLVNVMDDSRTSWVTTKNGTYDFPLQSGSKYWIVASKNDCGTSSVELSTLNLTTSKTLRADIKMLCAGDIVKVENIYYDLNKATIRADAAAELDNLADLMNKYPDMRIELRSHTDSRAEKSFNLRLSALRAQAVVDYLTDKGIVPYRMRAVGYGESQLLNGCTDGVDCTEEEHQQNRRTEFKVLSIAPENDRKSGITPRSDFMVNKSSSSQ